MPKMQIDLPDYDQQQKNTLPMKVSYADLGQRSHGGGTVEMLHRVEDPAPVLWVLKMMASKFLGNIR